jgi:crotonobetainyl-CoA:carnitine CoA-transferase CaiB-like acyl-CoA transferase
MVTPPLARVRVLDLTRFVSGAYATMVLSALGADVIKVEALPGGDPYRAQGTVQAGSLSGLFAALNTGKRSLAVDLRAAEGTALIRQLARGSDVFVQNARPGALDRAGLGAKDLQELNPRLVYASISGFGPDGPDAGRGGFDLILQAASGLMAVTGTPQSGPVKVGAPVLDIGSGISVVTGILAALLARAADGTGRTVSSSLLEFGLSCFTSYSTDMLETGRPPGLLGNDSPQFAPYGVFRCQDGAIALAGAGRDQLWARLCEVLGRPDWAADPRFASNAGRLRHRAELTAQIEGVLATATTAHWQHVMDEAGIPASVVTEPTTALGSAQTAALGTVVQSSTPDGQAYRTLRPPLSVDGMAGYSRGAPALGQHTAEILGEAGLGAPAIGDLLTRGIVAA